MSLHAQFVAALRRASHHAAADAEVVVREGAAVIARLPEEVRLAAVLARRREALRLASVLARLREALSGAASDASLRLVAVLAPGREALGAASVAGLSLASFLARRCEALRLASVLAPGREALHLDAVLARLRESLSGAASVAGVRLAAVLARRREALRLADVLARLHESLSGAASVSGLHVAAVLARRREALSAAASVVGLRVTPLVVWIRRQLYCAARIVSKGIRNLLDEFPFPDDAEQAVPAPRGLLSILREMFLDRMSLHDVKVTIIRLSWWLGSGARPLRPLPRLPLPAPHLRIDAEVLKYHIARIGGSIAKSCPFRVPAAAILAIIGVSAFTYIMLCGGPPGGPVGTGGAGGGGGGGGGAHGGGNDGPFHVRPGPLGSVSSFVAAGVVAKHLGLLPNRGGGGGTEDRGDAPNPYIDLHVRPSTLDILYVPSVKTAFRLPDLAPGVFGVHLSARATAASAASTILACKKLNVGGVMAWGVRVALENGEQMGSPSTSSARLLPLMAQLSSR